MRSTTLAKQTMSFDFGKSVENSVEGSYAGHNYHASTSCEADRQKVDPQGPIRVTTPSYKPERDAQ